MLSFMYDAHYDGGSIKFIVFVVQFATISDTFHNDSTH